MGNSEGVCRERRADKMAKKEKEYRKFPGTKKGFLVGRHTLWQGADHLLHVYSRVGVEDYKRFYFNDIQAIIARKSIAGKVQNIILGCFTLFFTLPAVLIRGEWAVFYAIGAGVFFLLLLVNLYRGPTAETTLLTAVQTEKLHSLHRLKNAFKVMDRLRPHLQSAQGTLSSKDLAEIPARRAASKTAQGISSRMEASKTAPRHEKGSVHMILFILLLFYGVLAASRFFFAHVTVTVLSSVTAIGLGIFVIIALVKQHNSDMPDAVRAITWACLGFVSITFAAGYVASMAHAFKNPAVVYNQWEFFKSMSVLSHRENFLIFSIDVFSICGALLIAIPGLAMLNRSGKKTKGHLAKTERTPYRPVVSGKTTAAAKAKLSQIDN